MTFAVLAILITWLPNARVVGDKATATNPVPLNCAVCGLVPASSLIVSVPVRVPVAVGVKITEIVQLTFVASVSGDIGQLEDCAKSPETEILLIVSGAVVVFLRRTVEGVLLV